MHCTHSSSDAGRWSNSTAKAVGDGGIPASIEGDEGLTKKTWRYWILEGVFHYCIISGL